MPTTVRWPVRVRVRDAEYLPLDNSQVAIEVTTPDGKKMALEAEPDENEAGAYVARHVPRQPGAYRAAVTVNAPDGSPVGQREAGWVAQPAAEEFNHLRPNRALVAEIAAKTGGEVVASNDLNRFVASLPTRKAPITEPWIRPAWHHPLFYLAIIACLVWRVGPATVERIGVTYDSAIQVSVCPQMSQMVADGKELSSVIILKSAYICVICGQK